MAFKMGGMSFGEGTNYKSPQLKKKEAESAAYKKNAYGGDRSWEQGNKETGGNLDATRNEQKAYEKEMLANDPNWNKREDYKWKKSQNVINKALGSSKVYDTSKGDAEAKAKADAELEQNTVRSSSVGQTGPEGDQGPRKEVTTTVTDREDGEGVDVEKDKIKRYGDGNVKKVVNVSKNEAGKYEKTKTKLDKDGYVKKHSTKEISEGRAKRMEKRLKNKRDRKNKRNETVSEEVTNESPMNKIKYKKDGSLKGKDKRRNTKRSSKGHMWNEKLTKLSKKRKEKESKDKSTKSIQKRINKEYKRINERNPRESYPPQHLLDHDPGGIITEKKK